MTSSLAPLRTVAPEQQAGGDGVSEVKPYVDVTCGHCGQTRVARSGAWLRLQRQRKGIGVRELARLGGVSPAMLSDVELQRRHATPRIEDVYRAYVLNGSGVP